MARNFFARLKGLLGTTGLEAGKGLYLEPCKQIHMIGMKYAIDVIFVDKQNAVVGLVKNIGPGRFSSVFPRAKGCLEVPAGTIDDTGTALGDTLESGPPPYS